MHASSHLISITLPDGSENSAVAGVLADPDQDGSNNLAEYAFGLDPRAAQGSPPVAIGSVTLGSETYDTFTFRRRHQALDLLYTVQFSTDLTTWTADTLPYGEVTDLGGGMEQVTFRDTTPSSSTNRFARVVATMQ